MKAQKLFSKIAFCLAGLLVLASIGYNIYQHQRNKELLAKPVPEKITNNESGNDSIIALKPQAVKTAQKSRAVLNIDELEGDLDATEEELDKTSEDLSEELTKKAEFKKAYKQLIKNLASNPAYQKSIRDSSTQSVLKSYDPLFKKLNMSKDESDKFKGLLADRTLEIQSAIPSNIVTASDEEKAIMNKQISEIKDKHNQKINEFLGEERNEIYRSYQQSLSERSSLSHFMKTVPPDRRINEEQAETLIDSMYAARQAIYDEMGPDIDMDSSANFTEENVDRYIDRKKMLYDKYVEESRDILPDDQVEQYKTYLKRVLNSTDSAMRTRLFMNGNK